MNERSVVLVTGASSEIGKGIAELLVARGYQVFGTSRKPSDGSVPQGWAPLYV